MDDYFNLEGACCTHTEFDFDGKCFATGKGLGDECSLTEQCNGGEHLTCKESHCRCADGFEATNGVCTKTEEKPAEIVCNDNQFKHTNGECYDIASASPDGPCVATRQCVVNSICAEGVCTCAEGYEKDGKDTCTKKEETPTETKVKPKKRPNGKSCERDKDCKSRRCVRRRCRKKISY